MLKVRELGLAVRTSWMLDCRVPARLAFIELGGRQQSHGWSGASIETAARSRAAIKELLALGRGCEQLGHVATRATRRRGAHHASDRGSHSLREDGKQANVANGTASGVGRQRSSSSGWSTAAELCELPEERGIGGRENVGGTQQRAIGRTVGAGAHRSRDRGRRWRHGVLRWRREGATHRC